MSANKNQTPKKTSLGKKGLQQDNEANPAKSKGPEADKKVPEGELSKSLDSKGNGEKGKKQQKMVATLPPNSKPPLSSLTVTGIGNRKGSDTDVSKSDGQDNGKPNAEAQTEQPTPSSDQPDVATNDQDKADSPSTGDQGNGDVRAGKETSDKQDTGDQENEEPSTDSDNTDASKRTQEQMQLTLEQRERECNEFKERCDKLEEEIKLKQMNVLSIQEESSVAKQKAKKLEEDNKEHRGKIRSLEETITSMEEVQTRQQQAKQQQDDRMEEQAKTIQYFQGESVKYQTIAKQQQKTLKVKEREIEDCKQEIKQLHAEQKDLKERFGKVAGQKMKHDNPDIINLGDKFRSTKIAETYSALYNDAWTDASAALQESEVNPLEDEKATTALLEVLQECYTFCNKKATEQFGELQALLLNPIQSVDECSKPRPTSADGSSPTVTTLKEVRKEMSMDAMGQVTDAFVRHLEKETGYGKKFVDLTKPYTQKCVEVCWAMALHVPPLYLEFKVTSGQNVDTNHYTKRSPGDTMKSLVWPPMFNGKGGGFLAKGTVECVRKIKKK